MIDLEAARSAVRDEIGSRLCHLTPHGTRICTRQVSSTCLCEETARAALCSQAPTPRCEVRSEALADQIHDACPHKIDEPPNCALVKSRLECVCEHVHMHAIRAARSGSPVLSALVDLHAVARVDRDEDYAAITNAAAVIEAAGSGCAAQTSFSPGEPVEIRKVEDEIDEIVIRCGDVHIEQMDASSWFLGVNASDGTYHQFWFGAKNRKSHVNFRHTESSPAASPSVPSADREGK